jgi:uncharacterized cupredoxin-like copper-binding protein
MADLPPDRGFTGIPRWVKVFGIIAIVLVLLVVVMLLAGGGGHGPGRHTGSGGAGGDGAPFGGNQNPGGVGGPADADEAARMVKITTVDTTRFTPSRISVSAGETVTFVVTNTGQAVHDFTLGDAAMQREHAEMMAHIPAGRGHDTPNSITLEPGTTKQLTWRFGDSATLEYGCHEAGHYQAGMRGQVVAT